MELNKTEMERVIALNEMMNAENPEEYETMQRLAIISTLSRRFGLIEMAEKAEDLFNEISHKFMKPVQ